MSDVEFEDEKYNSFQSRRFAAPQKEIGLWMVRKGVVKSASQANIIMIGILLLCLGLSAYFLFKNTQKAPALPPNAKIINEPGAPSRLETPSLQTKESR